MLGARRTCGADMEAVQVPVRPMAWPEQGQRESQSLRAEGPVGSLPRHTPTCTASPRENTDQGSPPA